MPNAFLDATLFSFSREPASEIWGENAKKQD